MERTWIEILFECRKEIYVERIYTDEIEKGESTWTKEFKTGPEDNYPNFKFKIIGNLDKNGKLISEGMIIITESGDKITKIGYRKSWCNHIAFR